MRARALPRLSHLYFWKRLGCHGVLLSAFGRACVCARPAITSDVDANDDDDDVRTEARLVAAYERQRQPGREPEGRAGETLAEDPRQRVDVQPDALRLLARRRPGQAVRELW